MVGKPLRTTIIIALVGAVIGAGIVVAVRMPQRIADRREAEDRLEKQKRQEMRIDIADLKIPEEYQELLKDSWYPYRPRYERWSEEQASEFWIQPGEVGVKILESRNEEIVEELFENVP